MHEEDDELILTPSQNKAIERKMIIWPGDVNSCLQQIRSYLGSLALEGKFFDSMYRIQSTVDEWINSEQAEARRSLTKESLEDLRNTPLFLDLEKEQNDRLSALSSPTLLAPYTVESMPL